VDNALMDVGLDVIGQCGGGAVVGETQDRSVQLSFNSSLKVDFQGSRVTSDGGLVLVPELDERCHRFRANEVRLWLSVIAYNLGNLWRRLALPAPIGKWSLTSLQQRLVNWRTVD
jgi:hypothetical protein